MESLNTSPGIAQLAALLLVGGLLAGCAGQPAVTGEAREAAPPVNDDERVAMLEEEPATIQRHRSGRLDRRDGGHNVTVYTREDLRNTGQTDMGEALRMLDPRFR